MKYDYLKDWKKRVFKRSEGRGQGLSFMLEEPKGENDVLIDLHLHTDFSDGWRSVREIGQQAQNRGVSKLEITDHDTIRPFNEINDRLQDLGHYNGDLINGVEITTKMMGDIVHVKVEDFDLKKANELINSEEFRFLNRNFKIRKLIYLLSERLKIVNRHGLAKKELTINDFIKIEIQNAEGKIEQKTLFEMGIDLEKEILQSISKGKLSEQIFYKGKTYNLNFDYFNSTLFRYIRDCENGQNFLQMVAKQKGEQKIDFSFFNRYFILDEKSPLYVEDSKFYPTIEEVCDFAKKAGGVAIFAHPFGYENLETSPQDLMKRAYKAGVDGFECLHGFNDPEQVEIIYKYCYDKGLLISAGSDLHKYYTSQNELAEVGLVPTKGEESGHKENPMRGIDLGTYNLHYFGSGAWRGEKIFDVDSEYQPEK